MPKRSQYSIQ